MQMTDIETKTKDLAVARDTMRRLVDTLNDELEAVRRSHMPRIKSAAGRVVERHSILAEAINSAPGLFESPRTVVFHGIRVGFRKGAGGIEWEDDARVVELIRKHFSKAEAELLIKTTETPIRKALAELDVAALRKIGCTVAQTGDVMVIKPTDTETDKIVNGLLKSATEAQREAA